MIDWLRQTFRRLRSVFRRDQLLQGMTGGWCGSLVPLETKHNGFHDICLPNVCSPPFKTGTCNQTIWRFDGIRYRLSDTTPPEPSTVPPQ
jgi:hypothetical protein